MDTTFDGETVTVRLTLEEVDAPVLLAIYNAEPDSLLPAPYIPRAFALARLGLLELVEDCEPYWDMTPVGRAVATAMEDRRNASD